MFLMGQIEYLTTGGLELSHISEIKITFITEFRFMTYNHYMDMPKQMVERNLLREIKENPKHIRSLQNMPEPVLIE